LFCFAEFEVENMIIHNGLARRRGPDRHPENDISGAACTAIAWLALYGIAIAASLLSGTWQHKHETPAVAAAPANLERPK
jgi:hypothetical protein